MSEESLGDLFSEIDAERQKKGLKTLSEFFLEWAEARGYITVEKGHVKFIESEIFVVMEWFDHMLKVIGVQRGALGIKIYFKT